MPSNVKVLLAGAAAAVVLAAGSTAALAATNGGGRAAGAAGGLGGTSCQTPSLPGSVVDVTLSDTGAMMGGGTMMGGGWYGSGRSGPGMMGGGWYGSGRSGPGMMAVLADPATVPAGTVSFAVANEGYLTHELVVLPLDAGRPGQRAVAADGTVSEDGSLGEASATCAAGEGEGIVAGSDGWVTLDLQPGRYELVCNLPGHYTAGMHAELDVTG